MKYKAFYTIPGEIWERDFIVLAPDKDAAILAAQIKCREINADLIDIRELTL